MRIASHEHAYHDVTRREPCPSCGGTSWCSLSDDGASFCRRQQGDGYTELSDRNGNRYWFRPGDGHYRGPARDDAAADGAAPVGAADPATLDAVYRYLFQLSPVAKEHVEALRARGLPARLFDVEPRTGAAGVFTAEHVPTREGARPVWFGSLLHRGKRRELLALWVQQRFPDLDLRTVPGFYYAASGQARLAGAAGLLVGHVDPLGRCVGVQVRLDRDARRPADRDDREVPKYVWLSSKKLGGSSPGAPPHVVSDTQYDHRAARHDAVFATVRLVEGALKAEVAHALEVERAAQDPTAPRPLHAIAVAGVGMFAGATTVATLRRLRTRRVVLAPDADWRRNEFVRRAAVAALRTLDAEGFEVALEVWEERDDDAGDADEERTANSHAKGLDDALLLGRAVRTLERADAYAALGAPVPTDEALATLRRYARVTRRFEPRPLPFDERHALRKLVLKHQAEAPELAELQPTLLRVANCLLYDDVASCPEHGPRGIRHLPCQRHAFCERCSRFHAFVVEEAFRKLDLAWPDTVVIGYLPVGAPRDAVSDPEDLARRARLAFAPLHPLGVPWRGVLHPYRHVVVGRVEDFSALKRAGVRHLAAVPRARALQALLDAYAELPELVNAAAAAEDVVQARRLLAFGRLHAHRLRASRGAHATFPWPTAQMLADLRKRHRAQLAERLGKPLHADPCHCDEPGCHRELAHLIVNVETGTLLKTPPSPPRHGAPYTLAEVSDVAGREDERHHAERRIDDKFELHDRLDGGYPHHDWALPAPPSPPSRDPGPRKRWIGRLFASPDRA